MENTIELHIVEAEERLRLAMLASDVSALDALLAPELVFINHLGQVLTKQDDLAAHQSGMLEVEALTPREQHIRLVGEVAIVHVQVQLAGVYAGVRSRGEFRFTRVWALSAGGAWQVIAAHASVVA